MEQRLNRLREEAGRAQELYDEGVEKARELAQTTSERSKEALDTANEWVRENPWMALGLVAGVGLIAGLILGQSGDRD